MIGFMIVAGVFFVFGVLVAWALCRAAADGDRSYARMVRELHARGPIRTGNGIEMSGCTYCQVAWPCRPVREL